LILLRRLSRFLFATLLTVATFFPALAAWDLDRGGTAPTRQSGFREDGTRKTNKIYLQNPTRENTNIYFQNL